LPDHSRRKQEIRIISACIPASKLSKLPFAASLVSYASAPCTFQGLLVSHMSSQSSPSSALRCERNASTVFLFSYGSSLVTESIDFASFRYFIKPTKDRVHHFVPARGINFIGSSTFVVEGSHRLALLYLQNRTSDPRAPGSPFAGACDNNFARYQRTAKKYQFSHQPLLSRPRLPLPQK